MGRGRRALAVLAACTLAVVALSTGFPSPSGAPSAGSAAAGTSAPARPVSLAAGDSALLDLAGSEGEVTGAPFGFVLAAVTAVFVGLAVPGLVGRRAEQAQRPTAFGSWSAVRGRGPPAPSR